VTLILRLLKRRFGTIDESIHPQVTALSLPLLEDLGEALLDFSEPTDLVNWLQTHSISQEIGSFRLDLKLLPLFGHPCHHDPSS